MYFSNTTNYHLVDYMQVLRYFYAVDYRLFFEFIERDIELNTAWLCVCCTVLIWLKSIAQNPKIRLLGQTVLMKMFRRNTIVEAADLGKCEPNHHVAACI